MTLSKEHSRRFEDLPLIAGDDEAGGPESQEALRKRSGVRDYSAKRVASAAALNGRHVLRDVLGRLGFELR